MDSTPQTLSSEFELNDKEKEQCYAFQKLVVAEYQKVDPAQTRPEYYTDLNNTTRFLIAREYKVPKAMEMWKKWYEWRTTYKVDSIKESEIAKELKTGKAFWFGHNKLKHPCLIIKIRRHIPGVSSVEDIIRFGVYILEEGIKKMQETGTSKICVIWDREGFSPKKNFDKSMLTVMKQLMGILQDFYAERLEVTYILKPNWFFKMIVGMMKPFMSDKTKKKIKVVNNTKELLDYFEPENLLKEYGGTSDFEYRWPADAPPVRDDASAAQDDATDVEDESIKAMAESEFNKE